MKKVKWMGLAVLATGTLLQLGGCGVWGLTAAGLGALFLVQGGLAT